MIHFMLDADRQQAVGRKFKGLAVAAQCLHPDTIMAGDVFKMARHGQAAFKVLLAAAQRFESWVNEYQRRAFVFGNIQYQQALVYVHLGCRKTNAGGGVHGLKHVIDELPQGVIDRLDRLGNGAQARIGKLKDGEQGHGYRLSVVFRAAYSEAAVDLLANAMIALIISGLDPAHRGARLCRRHPLIQRPDNAKNDKGKFPMIKRFAGWALVVVSACLISAAFAADSAAPAPAANAATPVVVNPDHPTSYTVQPGDTLWGIAEKFLENPWEWPAVWHINEQVANPHQISPGDVLRLTWKDGRPSLAIDSSPAGADSVAGIGSAQSITEVMPDGKTVKLRPRIRESAVASAIPAIPLKNIEAFLVDSRVMTLDELDKAPYIVAGSEKRIVMGRGDTIYARSRAEPWSENFPEYGVYRAGGAYVDPQTGEVLGQEARKIGSTSILAVDKNIATMRVLESASDLRVDDKLLFNDQRTIQSIFYPQPAPEGIEGEIIHIFGTIGFGARNDVVVINRGTREKIAVGQVFSIMQTGEVVRDRVAGDAVKLPPINAGLMIVFRTFDKVSYGLIMKSTRQIAKGDGVRSPRIDIGIE